MMRKTVLEGVTVMRRCVGCANASPLTTNVEERLLAPVSCFVDLASLEIAS